jgi:hypothetical protein
LEEVRRGCTSSRVVLPHALSPNSRGGGCLDFEVS